MMAVECADQRYLTYLHASTGENFGAALSWQELPAWSWPESLGSFGGRRYLEPASSRCPKQVQLYLFSMPALALPRIHVSLGNFISVAP